MHTAVCHQITLYSFRLTGRRQRRLDFWPWSDWLDWSGLFGCQFLQTDLSLLKHLMDRALLLENLLHLVLMETGNNL